MEKRTSDIKLEDKTELEVMRHYKKLEKLIVLLQKILIPKAPQQENLKAITLAVIILKLRINLKKIEKRNRKKVKVKAMRPILMI